MSKPMIKVAVPITGEEEAAAVREVILSGNFVSGKRVAEFEKQFADYIGVAAAAAVNNGTAALHLALAALGIGPGDEVIVPPLTFMSTVTAVLHQNAIPVFADIDADNFCLSPDDIRAQITDRTKAVIPVHLYGNAAEMNAIMKIADEHGLYVIEDCAQSHGTAYRDRITGSIGHLGAFSFFATKHMTTGEGGIVVSDNVEWIEQIKMLRSHGMIGRDDHVALGYNYRMNEMAAAMGLVQLGKLPGLNTKRIANSQYILEKLTGNMRSWYKVPRLSAHVKHTFFWCPLIIDEREASPEEVVRQLREKGIEVRHRYKSPLYKQKLLTDGSPYYKGGCPFRCVSSQRHREYGSLFLPNVEKIAGRIIGLPNHPAMTKSELERVVDTVLNLY